MNRKISSFLIIAVFVVFQALALMHIGGYGLEEHSHDGVDCGVCLMVKDGKLLGGEDVGFVVGDLLGVWVGFYQKDFLFSYHQYLFDSRAPPYFS